MERQADVEFRELKRKITEMGRLVEQAVGFSMDGLTTKSPEAFRQVHAIERELNRFHIEIDEDCLRLLARQAPLAENLRLVVAIIKINTDLERMGDQAVNIAYNAERYVESEGLASLHRIPEMAVEVRRMLARSLEAFIGSNVSEAKDVLKCDDVVDAFKARITRQLLEDMAQDPTIIDRAMCLILVSRNLERIADHATNIAEDAIFVCTGRDVRHGSQA